MSTMPIWSLITSRFIELRFFRGGKEIFLNTSAEVPAYSQLHGKLVPITRDEALQAVTDHMGWVQFRFRLATAVDPWSAVIRLSELEQILMQSPQSGQTIKPVSPPLQPHNYFARAA
jgi:hypothetical protein